MCVCNAAWFFTTVVSSLTDADRSDGILPTVLVSRKSEVQQGNARQIALLPGESVGCRFCVSLSQLRCTADIDSMIRTDGVQGQRHWQSIRHRADAGQTLQ